MGIFGNIAGFVRYGLPNLPNAIKEAQELRRILKEHRSRTMILAPEEKAKAKAIVSIMETDSLKPDYGKVTYLKGDVGQLTYGAWQTTLHTGNLFLLIQAYVEEPLAQHKELQNWLKPLKAQSPSVNTDKALHAILRKAGDDPVMQAIQEEFFEKKYWVPALSWANKNGFAAPLSMAVIFDSFIQSGGILPFLRKRFPALPPALGGKEKDWIKQYVDTRHEWLSTYSASKNAKTNKLLQNSSYRTKELQRLIKEDNWSLQSPFKVRSHKL